MRTRTECRQGHNLMLPNSTYKGQCRICAKLKRERSVPKKDPTMDLLSLWARLEHAMPYERANIRAQIQNLMSN